MNNKLVKTLRLFVMSLVALLFLVACGDTNDTDETSAGNDSAQVEDGTYEGSAAGYAGDVTVEVTLENGDITEIQHDHEETATIGGNAIESLTEDVLEYQSVNIDAVAGATVSSDAFFAAVTAALEGAGALGNFSDTVARETDEATDQETDIVVIGAGGAGLTAAIEAAEAGAEVIVLEQMPIIGGNTNKATGGMNASETVVQENLGVEDSNETFYNDTIDGGHGLNNPDLVSTMVENSSDTIDWINDLGAGLDDVSFSGGATNARIHKPEDGSAVGPLIVETLSNRLEELGVPIMLNSEVTSIIQEGETVAGVEVTTSDGQEFTVTANAVIIATGGFGSNADLIAEYDEVKAQFNSTNHAGATGSGITMGETVGADTVDMEQIQTHPTTDPETGDLYTEGVRGDGGILVNKEGERFIDELETRDVVSEAILNETDSVAYLTVAQNIADQNNALQGYINNGLAVEGETIEDLANELDMDPAVLEDSITSYNEAVASGNDEAQGRTSLSNSLDAGPYFAIPVTPGIHHTMGGLKINTNSEVLTADDEVIEGLYAAGEVTGGVHGGNRIGGNAVTDIVVFGRIAGQNAAEYISLLN